MASTKTAAAAPNKSKAQPVLPQQRHCTDVLFLLLFLGALGLICGALEYGLRRGDLDKIMYGQDYKGDLCGVDNSVNATGLAATVDVTFDDMTVIEMLWPFGAPSRRESYRLRRGQRDHRQRPYLYMSFPGEAQDSGLLGGWASAPLAICVSDCPRLNASQLALAGVHEPGTWVCTGRYSDGPPKGCPDGRGDAPECVAYRNAYFLNAGPSVLGDCQDPLSDCDVCFPRYHTLTALTFCLPEPRAMLQSVEHLTGGIAAFGTKFAKNATQADLMLHDVRRFVSSLPHLVMGDVRVAMPVIAGCVSLAFCFGFFWLVLVRLFSGFMVWLSLALAVLGLGLGCWQLHLTQKRMRDDVLYGEDERWTRQADAAHGGFWTLLVVTALFLLVVVCLRKQLAKAVRVIKAASMALSALPLLLLLPAFLIVLSLALLAGGVYVGALIISSGEMQLGRQGFGHLTLSGKQELLLGLHTLCAVWLCVYVRHVQHCAVAGGVSSWYFVASPEKRVGTRKALGGALRYHAGTIALGSLLLAVLRLVKWSYFFLRNRVRALLRCVGLGIGRPSSRTGRLASCCCQCIGCFLSCFERFLKTLSRYAYAQVMISGRPFCPSAVEAFRTLTANLAGAAALHVIASGFLFAGKLFVALACAALGWLLLITHDIYEAELYSVYSPVVVIGVASFMVASLFMGVYSMAIDTLFLCSCADKERGGHGKLGRGGGAQLVLLLSPDAMPQELTATADPNAAELKPRAPSPKRMSMNPF